MIARLALLVALPAFAVGADEPRLLDRDDFQARARSAWLGQCIANWTGLRTEGRRSAPPFYTDADWGFIRDGQLIDFVLTQNPWLADDDTDVEYVYLDELARNPVAPLTPQRVHDAWIPHINRFIWVSNARARTLMGRGVLPPMTGAMTANDQGLMIDAQLTTELFGLLCPGMPERALALGDPAVRAVSCGYASHAAQFHIVLYALAPVAPSALTLPDRLRWMYDRARAFIPASSKTADIADFVLADYLANPDKNNWERTRDAVYQRYQGDAASHGYRFRAWYESSVNFASLCAGLLYGGGDYRRTVQICTLWGWDSDNATATLGGLLGYMLGPAGLQAQFPAVSFSERFDIDRTRDGMPDRLPADPAAQDTFSLMAARMIPIVEAQILAAGGRIDAPRGRWLLPPAVLPADAPNFSPTNGPGSDHARSANLAVARAGGVVIASTNIYGSPPGGQGATWNPANFANGSEEDFTGLETPDGFCNFMSTQGGSPPGNTVILSVVYDRPVQVHTIRFIEGDHFDAPNQQGGWFDSLTFELRVNGQWVPASPASVTPLNPAVPFQIIDAVLPAVTTATGVRISGPAGGAQRFITAAELDALSPPVAAPWPTFDLNGDGRVDNVDLAYLSAHPRDLNGDGAVDQADRDYLASAAHWRGLRPDVTQ